MRPSVTNRFLLVRFACYCSLVAFVFAQSIERVPLPNGTSNDTQVAYRDSNDNIFDNVQQPTKRIIGGNNAPKNRYPYFVSLLETHDGHHKCAGSLVAPDIVLSAAHCAETVKFARVGTYFVRKSGGDENDELDGAELFNIEGPIYPHPLYNSGVSFSYDAVLLKLDRKSTNSYVRINTNPNFPDDRSSVAIDPGTQRNEASRSEGYKGDQFVLTVMGIGATLFTKYGGRKAPRVLQETTTSYIPNRVCRRSKDPNVGDNYQSLISEDMLCAFENSQDACQGDSGGPLIFKGNSPSNDLLVGIVSWGFGCAHPSFPGVYSRISYYSDWVVASICEVSDEPPLEFDCANVLAPRKDHRVPITIIIHYDDHPGEISWSIGPTDSAIVLVNVTEDINTPSQSRSQETVFLPSGSNFTFTIRDRYGDGLCCQTPGNYRVVLGRNAVGKILAYGGGDFGKQNSHVFQVPADYVDEKDEIILIEDGQIPLTVVIQLDAFPEEVGWRIDRLGLDVEDLIRVPTGIYTTPEMTIIRTIVLDKNELYSFSLYDMIGDGIGEGYVQLFLGTMDTSDPRLLIFESDGDFQSSIDHTFFASFNPTVPLPPSCDYIYLTVVMKLDLYPGEISIQLRMTDEEAVSRDDRNSGTVVFFRPPRFYKERVNEVITEHIPVPKTPAGRSRQYTFIIADRSGDGLCCSWNGELETGYVLYEGNPADDKIIVRSNFSSASREIRTFYIHGDKVDEITSDGAYDETAMINIKVTIQLDAYPDETGFYISDTLGRRLVYVPPKSFTNQNAIVERTFALHPGLYSFTIIDTYGDGMSGIEGAYRIDNIGSESTRPSILTGSGDFSGEKVQTFLLEGNKNQYPVTIQWKSGQKPKDFGFTIYRLDFVESVASVASRGRGEYDVPYEDISETMMIRKGGLYRIVFENSYAGVFGDIRVRLGSSSKDLVEYTIDTTKTEKNQWWQIKLFAGEPAMPLKKRESRVLTLEMESERLAEDFEWILISSSNRNFSSILRYPSMDATKLVAYGPLGSESYLLEGTHQETIVIPEPIGEKTYVLIVTGGNNEDLLFQETSPIRLYDEGNNGAIVALDRFETEGRVALFFSLSGSDSSGVLGSIHSAFRLSSAISIFSLVLLL